MTFAEFRSLHPNGEVMVWRSDVEGKFHRNPRHGHGVDYKIGSPGVEPFFLETWTAKTEPLDSARLPENELVLGVNEPDGLWVYPLEEVKKEHGVVHHQYSDRPIVVLSPEYGYTMSAWVARVDDVNLTFRCDGDRFLDDQTQSVWTVEGLAESGPLNGRRLEPVWWQYLEWHTWASVHPDCSVFRSSRPAVFDSAFNPAFHAAVAGLERHGYEIERCNRLHPSFSAVGAVDALAFDLQGDPLELLSFEDPEDAKDYELLDRHCARLGAFILRSMPVQLFADDAHSRPLRDKNIRWSPFLADESFLRALRNALATFQPDSSRGKGVNTLLSQVQSAGFNVRTYGTRHNPGRNPDAGPCYESQVPPRAKDGFRVMIEGDCFIVFRFESRDEAEVYAATEPHCTVVADFIVLRSDPPGQYRAPYPVVSFDTPVEEVHWSGLLNDSTFLKLCSEF
jgi:hypothetical protein